MYVHLERVDMDIVKLKKKQVRASGGLIAVAVGTVLVHYSIKASVGGPL